MKFIPSSRSCVKPKLYINWSNQHVRVSSKMSVDVFGRQSNRSKGRRGPPGVGYKLTADGHYDIGSKRLANVAESEQPNDAVNLAVLQRLIHSEIRSVYEITSDLRQSIDAAELAIQIVKDENVEKLKNIDLAIQIVKDENAEKLRKIDLAISELYEIVLKTSQNNDTSKG